MKIQPQTLQFETDVNTDRLAKLQALASLRQFLGFDRGPADYDVAGTLVCEPVGLRLEEVQARALVNLSDLLAAQRRVTASESEQAVQLCDQGYLQQASPSLEIHTFSYAHGAACLLDFLDATELSYRQALVAYMTPFEQLRQAEGTRDLE